MPPPFLLRLAFWIGVAGLVASLGVHLAAVLGAPVPGAAMALHVGVFAAFLPVVFGMKDWVERRGDDLSDFRSQWGIQKALFGLVPGWQKVALGVLFAYATVNFLIGFAGAMNDSSAGVDVRMFSGHWMVFYAVSAVFARVLLGLRQAEASAGARTTGPAR